MLEKSVIQSILDPILEKLQVEAAMLRLDQIHPIISGNKLFKLKYYLKQALETNMKGIVTFGGAYSNHLVATAFAAKERGLHAIGYVRGESNDPLTPTLTECYAYGMELKFVSRTNFSNLDQDALKKNHPEYSIVPQGGYGIVGAKGASDIIYNHGVKDFTHIIAACGTGTMGAGIINASEPNQHTILISVLKNNFSIETEVQRLLTDAGKNRNYQILFQYHMGGYAKKHAEVLKTMNSFFEMQSIPTDFVYTGKMVHAFYDLASNSFFKPGSKILLIHSGGLQGNRSLSKDELIF